MTKQEAEKEAIAALKRISAKQRDHWQVRVYKSNEWHWNLYALGGLFTLRASHYGGFYCLLSDSEHFNFGSMAWASDRTFPNPNAAIKHTIKLARQYADKINTRVIMAEGVLYATE